MITFQNLSIGYAGKKLFDNVNLTLKPKNKYGLIGANGAGKSTLIKLMLGEEETNSGEIIFPKGLRVGSLKQDQFKYEDTRIIDVVLQGNKKLWDARKEQEVLFTKSDITDEEGIRIAELETIIAENDGYDAESVAETILSGLAIDKKYFQEPLRKLSGGYKIRVLLAQCLFGNPDLLLLDEPTNHLDILSIQWLENFLVKKYKGVLILISHDHDFLNSICNNILDIDYQTITLYPFNYDRFVKAKELSAEQKLHQRESIEKRIAKDVAFIEKFRASTRSRQALSREKQIQKIEMPEIKKTSRIAPYFLFEQERSSGREVLEIKNLSKSFGEKKLFQNLSCKIDRGEKIAILGQNGIGKSTLLKTILGIIEPTAGSVRWGNNIKYEYFAQDHHDLIKGNANTVDWLMNITSISIYEKIRSALGKMLFKQDDALKSVSILSGGEATRLLFAKIMLKKPNIMILDEPTNHLDLESRDALANALQKFLGTVIFVSHDRNFIKIADRIIFLYDKGFINFHGKYKDFKEKYNKFFEPSCS
ncbi:MAG: ABC-F family ATP-binding cassette domain-containing protein [Rickettsiales bacterium]|nr:ABC-F family ATP-binding cassette domain-containing protein [Rickettsiales bacterium]